MKKKILILMADVNGGHKSAANGIARCFEEKNLLDEFKIEIIDLFQVADVEPFNTSNDSYKLFTKNTFLLQLNNLLFRTLNISFFYDIFYSYVNSRLYRAAFEIVEESNPQIIVSVHPIVSMVVNRLKKKENNFKSVVVITDLATLMRGWADNSADKIIAPTALALDNLVKFGVDSSKVSYPYFPLENKFQKIHQNKETIAKELNLDLKNKTVLITGGGGGTESLNKAISLLSKKNNVNILVMAGKDLAVKEKLQRKFGNLRNLHVIGFVNNMQDYLNLADVVIAKPGPATILECEIMKKRVIFSYPIGQQEHGNISYLLENPNFRYFGRDLNLLEKYLEEFLIAKTNSNQEFSRRSADECEKIVSEIISV